MNPSPPKSPSPTRGEGDLTLTPNPSPTRGGGDLTLTPNPSPTRGEGDLTLTPDPSPTRGGGDLTLTPNPSPSGRGALPTARLLRLSPLSLGPGVRGRATQPRSTYYPCPHNANERIG
ncbi:MAG: hypothetical protein BroJett007_28550 [Chloroflexota bacterium]|nr:MAG: hypothetical protein BroJett007_28550 [Chloroflexota bacterium]